MGDLLPFDGQFYDSFDAVPREVLYDPGYAGDFYEKHFKAKIESAPKRMVLDEDFAKMITLVNILSSRRAINVLDWGGALGWAYAISKKFFRFPDSLRWNIVDTPLMVKTARTLGGDIADIHFHESIDELEEKVDLVYFRQSFQVVPDYKALVSRLVERHSPEYFFICGCTLGANPEFITLLRLAGETGVPCRFYNEKELQAFFDGLGYTLVDHFYESAYKELDLSNFGPEYQMNPEGPNRSAGFVLQRR